MANLFGLIKVRMKVISSKTISTERASTDGPTDESTTASGSTIRWKARAPSPGVTAVDMLAAIKTTKSMVMEPLSGLTVVNTSENGAKASNTEKAYTLKKVKNVKESGKWARGSNGSKRPHHRLTVHSSESLLVTKSSYFLYKKFCLISLLDSQNLKFKNIIINCIPNMLLALMFTEFRLTF